MPEGRSCCAIRQVKNRKKDEFVLNWEYEKVSANHDV